MFRARADTVTRHSPRLVLILALATVAGAAALGARQTPAPPGPPAGFADAVVGRWDLTVQGADGRPFPSWVQVQLRKETELQGRFVGQFGSVRNITKIAFADGTLSFDVPVQYEQNKSDLHFEGKLSARQARRHHRRREGQHAHVDGRSRAGARTVEAGDMGRAGRALQRPRSDGMEAAQHREARLLGGRRRRCSSARRHASI